MDHEILISYASKDLKAANATCEILEMNKIRCWIAHRDILPGTTWAKAIVNAIPDSRLIVLILSSHSNKSPQVMREVERAVHRVVPILPLRIEEVIPFGDMEFYLSTTHWLDALPPPFEAHLERVAIAVKNILGISKPSPEKLYDDRWQISGILHNLPSRSDFVGRRVEKKQIRKALKSRSHMVSIQGIGGSGKSSLALEIAHELLTASLQSIKTQKNATFYGYVWHSKTEGLLTLDSLLDKTVRILEHRGITKQSLEDKKISVHKLLQRKPCLLIIDNYDAADDQGILTYLVSLPEPSKVLITTRERHVPGAHVICLAGLVEKDALSYIRREGKRLGLNSISRATNAVLAPVYNSTGGLPLAIKWIISQIQQKGLSLDSALSSLSQGGDNILEGMFRHSWELLSVDARKLLVAMTYFRGSASHSGIESAVAIERSRLDNCLGQLVQMSLIETTDDLSADQKRYLMHPLTRSFARSKWAEILETTHDIQSRLFAFYRRQTLSLLEMRQLGYSRLEKEKENLVPVIEWGYHYQWNLARDLSLSLKWFFWEHGYWHDMLGLYGIGVAYSEHHDDHIYRGKFLCEIGWIYCRQSKYDLAHKWTLLAQECYTQITADKYDLANLYSLRACIEKEQGGTDRARELLQKALVLFGDRKDAVLELLRIMTYLGELCAKQQRFQEAEEWFRRTMTRAEKTGVQEAVAWSLGNLGVLKYVCGDSEEASHLLQEGLKTARAIARHHTIAECSYWLGLIAQANESFIEARILLTAAEDIYSRLGIESKIRNIRETLNCISKE